MKEIEIIDEENYIQIDDEFGTNTFKIFPENKKIKRDFSIKNDCFFAHDIIEYKISVDPIEIQMRTLESFHEPPKEYAIRDGVVLESEIVKDNVATRFFPDRIEKLKKEVEWNKVPLLDSEINLYILSKHPEIISSEDYRKFLRQSLERIRLSILKVEEAIEETAHDLEIRASEYGKSITYSKNELEEKERAEYCALPEEKREKSEYGKKINYIEKFKEPLFKKDSPKYVGISEHEFEASSEILEYIENLLNKREASQIKKPVEKISKTKGVIISLLLTLFISWVASWFVDINPFLIFILVQLVSFIQSIIGGWLEKFFNSFKSQ